MGVISRSTISVRGTRRLAAMFGPGCAPDQRTDVTEAVASAAWAQPDRRELAARAHPLDGAVRHPEQGGHFGRWNQPVRLQRLRLMSGHKVQLAARQRRA